MAAELAPAQVQAGRALEVAVEAARRAGRIIQEAAARHGDAQPGLSHKGDIDLVTDADRAAEAAVIDAIHAAFPDHGIIAEEGSGTGILGHGDLWIIDPLDGTTNFVHGVPHYCVSIAYEHGGELLAGVVFDPSRDELFTARAGGGAALNGKPIRVSATDALKSSVLATGFPYDRVQNPDSNHLEFERFNLASQGVRRFGAAALDLAWVACGRYDAYWELRLNSWDVSAGALCVLEAGGRVSDYEGGPDWRDGREIVASNTFLHEVMLENLRSDGAPLGAS